MIRATTSESFPNSLIYFRKFWFERTYRSRRSFVLTHGVSESSTNERNVSTTTSAVVHMKSTEIATMRWGVSSVLHLRHPQIPRWSAYPQTRASLADHYLRTDSVSLFNEQRSLYWQRLHPSAFQPVNSEALSTCRPFPRASALCPIPNTDILPALHGAWGCVRPTLRQV